MILHCRIGKQIKLLNLVCCFWVLQRRPLTSFTGWAHCQVKTGQHVQSSRQPSQMDVRWHFFTPGETAVPSVDNLHFWLPPHIQIKLVWGSSRPYKSPAARGGPLVGCGWHLGLRTSWWGPSYTTKTHGQDASGSLQADIILSGMYG